MENELQPRPSQTCSGGNFFTHMTKTNHPTLIFNDNRVHQVILQKISWNDFRLQTKLLRRS